MPNFKELLSKNADAIERPKPLPAGTYLGMVGTHDFGESKDKKTPFVKFNLSIQGPGPDIDPELLTGLDLNKKKMSITYYLSEDAQYRVKEMAASCGIPVAGRSLGEIIEDVINVPVIFEVNQKNSQSGDEIYNEVKNMKGAS